LDKLGREEILAGLALSTGGCVVEGLTATMVVGR
jgi:hypothetical protein